MTISQAATYLSVAAGIIGSIGILYGAVKKLLTGMLKDQTTDISKQISGLSDRVDGMRMDQCKNFIIACISDIEHGQTLTEMQMQRFSECYDYYIAHKGNGYIRGKVKKLQESGKI
jgi:hypothetical protein